MTTAPARILIVGPSWVGDMVMAQSLFITLKQHHPESALDVLAPPWSAPLVACMPEVRALIASPFQHGQFALARRYQLGRELRARHYDWAIVLPNSWKAALVPYFAHVPQRTGYIGEARWGLLNDWRRLDTRTLPRTVERFVALAYPQTMGSAPPCPPPRLLVDDDAARRTLHELGLTTDRPLLALCPGAEYGPAKRWPPEHFAAVARDRLQQGWQVCLLGSANDQASAATIQQIVAGRAFDLTGRTTLAQAVDVLAHANAVVSNDSGLMHVAAALGVPVVAVYGSSDPRFTPPLSDRARIVSLDLPCAPCFRRVCPLHHTRCLNDLPPERVLAALNR